MKPIQSLRSRSFSILVITLAVAGVAVAATNRPSALAGTWYPADPATLTETVDGLLDAAKGAPPDGIIRALIAPHAGYRYSGATAAAAFALVRGGQYERVILLAPSHRSGFHGLSIASVDAYETPLGEVPLDLDAIDRLRRSPMVQSVAQAHASEHAIEIELPFLQRALQPGWRLVPILVGDVGPEDYPAAADLLRPLADGRTLVVVSSDFTHYGPRFGYVPFPPDDRLAEEIKGLDDAAIEHIVARDGPGLLEYRARTGITICGYRPLVLMLELLPPRALVHRIAYATSAQLTGERTHSVSYAALAVTAPRPLSESESGPGESTAPAGLDPEALKRLHGLAVLGVRRAALGRDGVPDDEVLGALNGLPPGLQRQAGAFVTLWKQGELRGCVGHVPNDLPVYEAVLISGVNAARNDRRFQPVRAEELDALEVEVSVLTPPRPIESIDSFQPGEHGITLRKGEHYALYLPEVAPKMGWDRETTLSQLALKAGLPADAWREGASFEIFTSAEYRAPYWVSAEQSAPEPNQATK